MAGHNKRGRRSYGPKGGAPSRDSRGAYVPTPEQAETVAVEDVYEELPEVFARAKDRRQEDSC